MSVDKILAEWKKKKFSPVYWLEGEEPFFIDVLVDFAEHQILSEQEASFNLTVLYGKDAAWADVVNACRKYPMFSDLQLVILKEAQQMKDIEKLLPYINQPLHSTIFIIAYREKKVDSRTTFGKTVKAKTAFHSFKPVSDQDLAPWAEEYISAQGLQIGEKAVQLLTDHTGNDLNVLTGEVKKIMLNLGARKEITEADIEVYVGVSKEFNTFELQKAIAQKDLYKAIRIIKYFESNPKAGPIQMVNATLYAYFSKVYMLFGIDLNNQSSISAAFGNSSYFVNEYKNAAKKYGEEGICRILLLLHHYNLRSIGINDSGTSSSELLKEMVVKMING
ncbi:DNA polymerase III subunit delta [Pollutibacter soli]|uniref:DNA polymerase III subunit delta n=1 Tax=Pollutibacter soli TaxID=3034157 RepID=UPI003013FB06